MKKLILLTCIATSIVTYAQTPVKNGTIYKEHPYITKVNDMMAKFIKQDTLGMAAMYADSVKFYDSPSPKGYDLKAAKAQWQDIYANWEQIDIKPQGYPDGLEYTKEPFTVQSWWVITAVNKKTKKTAKFHEVIFSSFNKDGKVTMELAYYDMSALTEAMKP